MYNSTNFYADCIREILDKERETKKYCGQDRKELGFTLICEANSQDKEGRKDLPAHTYATLWKNRVVHNAGKEYEFLDSNNVLIKGIHPDWKAARADPRIPQWLAERILSDDESEREAF